MNAPASHTATPADVLAGRARWCVVEGDCAEALRSLPIGCIDALVSDPPSGIAFMGAEWDRDKGGRLQWVAWLSGILSDARRATRDGMGTGVVGVVVRWRCADGSYVALAWDVAPLTDGVMYAVARVV